MLGSNLERILTHDKELLIGETINYLIDSVPEPYKALFIECIRLTVIISYRVILINT